MKSKLKIILCTVVIIIAIGVSKQYAQGLHIAEDHTVLFGADTLGTGVKTVWFPKKAAFWTGSYGQVTLDGVTTSNYSGLSYDEVGLFSMAAGSNNKASGDFSMALGRDSQAKGLHSLAFGYRALADNDNSVAIGEGAVAYGNNGTAVGNYASASQSSVSFGYYTSASGTGSVAIGNQCYARGLGSMVFGRQDTEAIGSSSTSMGLSNSSISFGETVMGMYSQDYVALDTFAYHSDDRLFVLGNGVNPINRSNAMVILKNGKTGIGVNEPKVLLEVSGIGADKGGRDRVNEIIAHYNTSSNNHTAIAIDAEKGQDAIIYLAEDGVGLWDMRHDFDNHDFNIRYQGGTGLDDTKLLLDIMGNLTIDGTLNPSSDINRKEAFLPINEQEILNSISELPIVEWQYKGENVRHIGPMAQDFYAAFQLGQGDKTIATVDADGIALSAIKALNNKINEQQGVIEQLIQRIEELEKE